MKKYYKKYRVIGEFTNDDKLAYSEKMEDCGNFVYCDTGNIMISRYSPSQLRVDITGSGRYKKILSKIQTSNIPIVWEYEGYKEGTIVVEEKNTTKLFTICKAKRQRNTPVSIINEKDNLNYFKRTMKKFNNKKGIE